MRPLPFGHFDFQCQPTGTRPFSFWPKGYSWKNASWRSFVSLKLTNEISYLVFPSDFLFLAYFLFLLVFVFGSFQCRCLFFLYTVSLKTNQENSVTNPNEHVNISVSFHFVSFIRWHRNWVEPVTSGFGHVILWLFSECNSTNCCSDNPYKIITFAVLNKKIAFRDKREISNCGHSLHRDSSPSVWTSFSK